VALDGPLGRPRVFVLAAANLKEARLRGNPNWLIDTTPATRTALDAELAVGKTFTDPVPGGPVFTLLSADETRAVVRVQINGEAPSDEPGSGVCGDDSPFTGPGPEACQAPVAPPRMPTPDAAPPPEDADPNAREDAPPLNRNVVIHNCGYAAGRAPGTGGAPLLILLTALGLRRRRPRGRR
jgi:hypothetical protein